MIGSKNISCICLKGRLTEIKTFSDAQSQLMHFLKERGCQGSSMFNLVYLTNGSKKAYELMYIFLKTINVKFVLFMGTEIARDKAVIEHLHSQYFSARTILPYISFLLLISFLIEQDRIKSLPYSLANTFYKLEQCSPVWKSKPSTLIIPIYLNNSLPFYLFGKRSLTGTLFKSNFLACCFEAWSGI